LDASHFDDLTLYAAINRFRLDDLKPHIYRTHDGGKTWKEIVEGLPDAPVNTVREDPVRKGLLYAGTELAVYVSFDDGDHWAPLRLNMPAISIRDLTIHENDLVAGTHGRGFWILDDISPLREMSANVAESDAHLFRPAPAMRVRWNNNTDTPLPPDEPAGENPPDGAIFYYYLKSPAAAPVKIEIFDSAKKLVRSYSSDAKPVPIDNTVNVPTYWIRPAAIPSTAPGMHRFVWDLTYPAPDSVDHDYPISAIVHNTPRAPLGPLAAPGEYSVRLTVGDTTLTQPLTLRMGPRIKTPLAGFVEQFKLAQRVTELMHRTFQNRPAMDDVNRQLAELLGIIESADAAPTPTMVAAVDELERKVK